MIVIDSGELAAFGADANEVISAGIVWAEIMVKVAPEVLSLLVFDDFCIKSRIDDRQSIPESR